MSGLSMDQNLSAILAELNTITDAWERSNVSHLQTRALLDTLRSGQCLDVLDQNPIRRHTVAAVEALSLAVAATYGTDVPGDIAEFGTMTGETACGLARGIAASDRHLGYAPDAAGLARKRLLLFDSFEGLPQAQHAADVESPHVRTGMWNKGTCKVLSQGELHARVTEYLPQERVQIFAGWFADTVPTLVADTRLALIHIDSDLYQSAIDVLVPLFARGMIAQGARVFFDDWNCNQASPRFGERRAWRECVERFGIEYSDEGAYGMLGHRFIVHSYS
jgi:macrocin-O-methyltransferase TylF-like protien